MLGRIAMLNCIGIVSEHFALVSSEQELFE